MKVTMKDFIENLADQFDDTEITEFNAETIYRDLDEWSSLTALAVLNMMEKKYNVTIKAEEMNKATTIQELFELLQSS
jgi:acyl carrier protein